MYKYQGFDIEEDDNRFRDFMSSEQFRAVCKAIQRIETDNDGLTPSEVWHETDNIIADLRTLEADDRETYVTQLFNRQRRRLKTIERDGDIISGREREQVDRTLTCIFYCLCLRLERACRRSGANPHSDVIDAIVEKIIEIANRDTLQQLYTQIKTEGERIEARKGSEISELDPLADHDSTNPWSTVAEHYAERLFKHVPNDRRDAYNQLWDELKNDQILAACMSLSVPLQGDEHDELGVEYNAKAVFNLLGMIYSKGYFCGFKGIKPFMEASTAHYDRRTKNKVTARSEYFTPEKIGAQSSHIGLTADLMKHINLIINNNLKR